MTSQPRGAGFATLALHASAPPEAASADSTGATASLGFDGADPVVDPINATLEERIATLEGGSAALAVGAGHAAHLIVLHILLRPGDAFIASERLRARRGRTFERAYKNFGWQVEWVDPDRAESVVEALADRTRAILIESIAEDGEMTDIEAVASIARRARIPLIVDNSTASPYLVRPAEHGADIVVHASTRLLTGHPDAAGGLIVDAGTFEWTAEDRFPSLSQPDPGRDGVSLADTYGNFAFAVACRHAARHVLGAPLPAADAALVLRGLETLALRVQRQSDSALAVAQHLSRHHAVDRVRYAGLDGDPAHQLARRYCPRGAGVALRFGPTGGAEAADALVRRLALFAPLTHAGDTRSRIAPAAAIASPDGDAALLHVSIGLEDPADIIADLDRGLAG